MKPSLAQILLAGLAPCVAAQSCPDYAAHSKTRHEPFSPGKHALSYARPAPGCRTFNSSTLETLLTNVTAAIADPDLARLFENTYPNTLDTTVRWHGRSASNPAEELTFLITGDIDAMWLRDSANQLASYTSLIEPDAVFTPDPNNTNPDPTSSSIASLFRGLINLQSRSILTAPFCNAFQPPPESHLPPSPNPAAETDSVFPPYDPEKVFECKYELDSLASFLHLSTLYHDATHDAAFFGHFSWLDAVQSVLATAKAMTQPTYSPADGSVLEAAYRFTRLTTRATETLANDGVGSPVRKTGMVRSAFRPSDDAATWGFLVPGNMMFAAYLEGASLIVEGLMADDERRDKVPEGLAEEMRAFSRGIREAVGRFGVVSVPVLSNESGNGTGAGEVETETAYAYEVNGYGSAALMDDANVPSLLAAPLLGFLGSADPVYQRTRARVLSAEGNPYFMRGSVLNGIGSPHTGPGMAWPMASIVRILTSDDDDEIVRVLKELLGSTDGLGLMHESVKSNNASQWTRQWFSWANGLFGQMILDLRFRKPHILGQSFQ